MKFYIIHWFREKNEHKNKLVLNNFSWGLWRGFCFWSSAFAILLCLISPSSCFCFSSLPPFTFVSLTQYPLQRGLSLSMVNFNFLDPEQNMGGGEVSRWWWRQTLYLSGWWAIVLDGVVVVELWFTRHDDGGVEVSRGKVS